MVVAFNDTAVGSFEKDITVHDSAVISNNLPKILHVNDKLSSNLSIHNLELNDDKFKLNISCEGSISCNLDTTTSVPLSKLKSIPYTVSVNNQGKGRVIIEALNGKYSYRHVDEIEVASNVPSFYSAKAFSLKPKESLSLDYSKGYSEDTLYSLQQGTIPYVNLKIMPLQLANDHNIGAQDLISSILGLIENDEFIKAYASNIQKKINSLESYIQSSGQINDISYEDNNYATARALKALVKAQEKGFYVNPSLLEKIYRYTNRMSKYSGNENLVQDAQILESLALAGDYNLASVRYLADSNQAKSPLGLAILSRTLKYYGDDSRAQLALTQALNNFDSILTQYQKNKQKKTNEFSSIYTELKKIENAQLAGPAYDLAEILNAALAVGDNKLINEAMSHIINSSYFGNYMPHGGCSKSYWISSYA